MEHTHRNRHIEFWVEKAAVALVRAQQSRGEDEVAERIEQAVSAEDYETTARVLRIIAREFHDVNPKDLRALDARLQSLADAGRIPPPDPSAGPQSRPDAVGHPESAARPNPQRPTAAEPATAEPADDAAPKRPGPAKGLRSVMRGGRPR